MAGDGRSEEQGSTTTETVRALEALVTVRKIVDSNFLQSPKLREFLEESRSNYAVLTDYAAMEAYKGNTLTSISRSMAILTDYPDQVIVLKNTLVVCGLKAKGSGLQSRLIDERQTKEFATYCRALRGGKANIRRALLDHGREADAQLDLILKDALRIKESIDDVASLYTPEELRALRTGSAYTTQMFDKLVESVLVTAALLFKHHPKVLERPEAETLGNRFIFRASLCMHILAIDWISVGGAERARPERLRNDMVDTNFAAYATYFDGLLSDDRKAMRIYRIASMLLRAFFAPPGQVRAPS